MSLVELIVNHKCINIELNYFLQKEISLFKSYIYHFFLTSKR